MCKKTLDKVYKACYIVYSNKVLTNEWGDPLIFVDTGKYSEVETLAEKKKGNTVDIVWGIAQPLAEQLGLLLWDVRFQKEGANWYLRIIIDKEDGVGIDDCVAMNDALDAPLDEADPIDQSYNLQVCSAGIERELVRDFHFEMFMGADIMVKFPKADETGVKLRKGVLKGYDKGTLTVEYEDGTERTYEKKEYTRVQLDDFEGF